MRVSILAILSVAIAATCPAMDYFPFHHDQAYIYQSSPSCSGQPHIETPAGPGPAGVCFCATQMGSLTASTAATPSPPARAPA